ncbi:hypothetical protein GBO93_07155 [Pediococcus acidilactici]|uniref:hypothetical protein n=1 Tax=Pediococcus acidilactici TaxID=1254 RepID=UPI00132AB321|nr:hypothetical protein [Pediococcus acidilactici]KAF0343817.1 hypothetical protein GBO43_08425 [Pediococcus acidilactici]KAF0353115.1 hypothetical protein GBO47_09135 [Pediococcus acidilactici]KAF0357404.1 hypothetical protein GBO51_09115 [Pediococcus acidilactici]KAF0361794.1 hypothetical protein GBO53_09320 [Pediococcus acidilactici]KAF0408490.1 hypothetical protein GBO74_08945 [Pediococcus acidilactici]
MKNAYVVKLGNLYFKEKESTLFGNYRYKMTDSLNDASIRKGFDSAKKTAEDIGGKVYRVILEKVKS